MFRRSDTMVYTILYNVYEHLKQDWDYCLVICGDTGTGKSHWALHLLEMWYTMILKQPFGLDRGSQVTEDYAHWVKRFKELGAYDMNIFDEAARGLESRQHMEKVSKDLTLLFNVFRKKKFFSVLIIPSFFYLSKYFREFRIRGLVWVPRRGEYRFYTKEQIKMINGINEKKNIKSLKVVRPFHIGGYSAYDGILLKDYEKQSMIGVDKMLDDVIQSNEFKKVSGLNLSHAYFGDVKKLRDKGLTQDEIKDKLGISKGTVNRLCVQIKHLENSQ